MLDSGWNPGALTGTLGDGEALSKRVRAWRHLTSLLPEQREVAVDA